MVVVSLDHSPVVATQVVSGVRSACIGCRDDPRALVLLERVPGQEIWVVGQIATQNLLGILSIPIERDTGIRL